MTAGDTKRRRDAAYAILAGAMLGDDFPGEDAFSVALDVVMADGRKTRTKAERMIQMFVATTVTIFVMSDALQRVPRDTAALLGGSILEGPT